MLYPVCGNFVITQKIAKTWSKNVSELNMRFNPNTRGCFPFIPRQNFDVLYILHVSCLIFSSTCVFERHMQEREIYVTSSRIYLWHIKDSINNV